MDKYEAVRDIGSGNFGIARLMRNRETRELVAVKCIERGHRVRCFCFVRFLNFLVAVCSAWRWINYWVWVDCDWVLILLVLGICAV
jgi:hypothetical protein